MCFLFCKIRQKPEFYNQKNTFYMKSLYPNRGANCHGSFFEVINPEVLNRWEAPQGAFSKSIRLLIFCPTRKTRAWSPQSTKNNRRSCSRRQTCSQCFSNWRFLLVMTSVWDFLNFFVRWKIYRLKRKILACFDILTAILICKLTPLFAYVLFQPLGFLLYKKVLRQAHKIWYYSPIR